MGGWVWTFFGTTHNKSHRKVPLDKLNEAKGHEFNYQHLSYGQLLTVKIHVPLKQDILQHQKC